MSAAQRAGTGELRDVISVLDSHEERLDAGDEKLAEHDRAFALNHQEMTTLRNEIIILRDGMSEYCNRVLQRFDAALRRLDRGNGKT